MTHVTVFEFIRILKKSGYRYVGLADVLATVALAQYATAHNARDILHDMDTYKRNKSIADNIMNELERLGF